MFYFRLMKCCFLCKKCSKISFSFPRITFRGQRSAVLCWVGMLVAVVTAMHCLRKVSWYQLYLLGAICLSHCHTAKALVLLDHGICLPKELPDLPAPIRILGLYICGLQHHEDNKGICGLCYCVPSVHGTLSFQKKNSVTSFDCLNLGCVDVCVQVEETLCAQLGTKR